MYRGARGGRRPAHPGARRRGGRALRALHVLSRIDAVDRERTKAYAYRPGAAVGERGTVASLAPIIGEDSLYGCVLESDMTLSTAGIDGPRIFRVPRWDLWPVVTSEIKDALERLGATGVSYTSLRPTPSRGARTDADVYRGTALGWAAWRGRVAAVTRLLELGADPNARTTFGGPDHGEDATALHLAAEGGHLDVIRALLGAGADPTTPDARHGHTPAGWAEHNRQDAARALLRDQMR